VSPDIPDVNMDLIVVKCNENGETIDSMRWQIHMAFGNVEKALLDAIVESKSQLISMRSYNIQRDASP
jgi:hypothetical protein